MAQTIKFLNEKSSLTNALLVKYYKSVDILSILILHYNILNY